jgi:anti-anti-sigma factor
MDSIQKLNENYAVVFNINLLRATLNEASEFRDHLAQAILESDKDIIVNLSNCEHLDSTFLGVLVSSFKKLKTQNRNLLIIEPTDKSSIFLTLNSIGKIFPLYSSVNSALEDIENKKIIESEINELGDDGRKKEKSTKKIATEISSKPIVYPKNDPKPQIEEMIPEETIDLESLNTKKEEPAINPQLEETVQSENEIDVELTPKTFKLKSDEHSNVINVSPHLDDDEDTPDKKTVSKNKTVAKEKSVSNERVEWEFGFN